MEAVIFDGKEYVKASVVAEKFRYTQDYLGQLCRGKKVDARLVGRAWYLNLDSLEEHRTGRHKTPAKSSAAVPKKVSSNYLSRIDVEPVLKNKTVKIFKEKNGKMMELPVRYEQDEYSLIPRVNKSAISTSIPILPAEAERLKIKKEANKFNVTDFKAEALPEVFLSGAVKVDGIPEALEEDDSTKSDITNKIKPGLTNTPSPKRLVSVRQPVKRLPMGTRVDMRPVESHKRLEIPNTAVASLSSIKATERAPETFKKQIPKHPSSLGVSAKTSADQPAENGNKKAPVRFSPDVVVPRKVVSKVPPRISDWVLVLVVFLLATIASLLVFVTNREVLVERGSYVDNLSFDISNLNTFLMPLFTN